MIQDRTNSASDLITDRSFNPTRVDLHTTTESSKNAVRSIIHVRSTTEGTTTTRKSRAADRLITHVPLIADGMLMIENHRISLTDVRISTIRNPMRIEETLTIRVDVRLTTEKASTMRNLHNRQHVVSRLIIYIQTTTDGISMTENLQSRQRDVPRLRIHDQTTVVTSMTGNHQNRQLDVRIHDQPTTVGAMTIRTRISRHDDPSTIHNLTTEETPAIKNSRNRPSTSLDRSKSGSISISLSLI